MIVLAIVAKIVLDTDEVYELPEAAKQLKIGIATLFRWMRGGKIIPLRISGRTFIPASEIARLTSEGGDNNESKRDGDAGATTASQKESKG